MKPKFKKVSGTKWFGKIDFRKGVISVNKKKGEVLDTIVHELTHFKHPKASEKSVQAKTRKKMRSMSKSEKSRLYKKLK